MKKTKEYKAITMIAIIITIVVLLILTAVTMTSIKQYDIIEKANSASKNYGEVVNIENSLLKNYTNTLDQSLGGYGIEGNGSKEAVYKIGDLVQVKGEVFYVIEDCGKNDTTILLLAKECIHTEKLLQGPNSSINKVAFSKTNYWSTIENIEYPYDLIETGVPDETHYAARAAYNYGVKLGGQGRIIKYSEVEALKDKYSDLIFSKESALHYWVSRAESEEYVWLVLSTYGGIFGNDEYKINFYMGVRPVLEISKIKVSPYTNN